jgi:hypothetical protein
MMKMNRKKLLSMALSLSVSAAVWSGAAEAQTWERWIDYGYPGYSETGNSWRTYPSPQSHNGSYRYLSHWDRGVKRVGKAKWAVTVPVTGIYEVTITYRKTENRTPDANYFVVRDREGNLEQHIINQSSHSTSYEIRTLGQYEYGRGQEVYVLLDGTDDNYSDCADAARFKLIKELSEGAAPAINSLLLKPVRRPK